MGREPVAPASRPAVAWTSWSTPRVPHPRPIEKVWVPHPSAVLSRMGGRYTKYICHPERTRSAAKGKSKNLLFVSSPITKAWAPHPRRVFVFCGYRGPRRVNFARWGDLGCKTETLRSPRRRPLAWTASPPTAGGYGCRVIATTVITGVRFLPLISSGP